MPLPFDILCKSKPLKTPSPLQLKKPTKRILEELRPHGDIPLDVTLSRDISHIYSSHKKEKPTPPLIKGCDEYYCYQFCYSKIAAGQPLCGNIQKKGLS
jgi:hypothetical protein